MNDNTPLVPELNLAPKFRSPLSFWNLLDYLRILYWAFFFPQALVEYTGDYSFTHTLGAVERNRYMRGSGSLTSRLWGQIRAFFLASTMARNLYLQGLLLIIVVPIGITFLLQAIDIPLLWRDTITGIAIGLTVAVIGASIYGALVNAEVGVPVGLALGMPIGIVGTIAYGLVDATSDLAMLDVAWGLAMGVVFGMVLSILLAGALISSETILDTLPFVTLIFVVTSVIVIALNGPTRGLYFSVATIVTVLRFPAAGLSTLQVASRSQGKRFSGHLTPIPIPGLQRRLCKWLQADQDRAIANLNELHQSSLQLFPIVGAVSEWLESLPDETLLPTVDKLYNTHQNYLLRYTSASLANRAREQFVKGLILVPRRLRNKKPEWFDSSLRFDTAARAACAGYWLLNYSKLTEAASAFEHVKHLPGGTALLNATRALASAPTKDGDLAAIVAWGKSNDWLPSSAASSEPKVIMDVRMLREVALEADNALNGISSLNQNAALGRATARLADITDYGAMRYFPLSSTRRIATQWRDVLARAGGEIGQLTIDRPVPNPYVVGDPVVGRLFAGREIIMRRLEELWGIDPTQPAPSVVLYGHRRMGKTSILRNLGARFGRDTVVVPFSMQRVGRVRDTADLLLAVAERMADDLSAAGLPAPALPDETAFAHSPYRAFNAFLAAARDAAGRRRVILTIDEFEAIEAAIADGRVEADLLAYLRGVIQGEPWLVLAFAGLHTLQEMTGDYWNPLFGSVTPIKVGFLRPATSADLLANPDDDFPLDFSRAAAERVYDHVRGQPYLTQLVGHTLVSRYNRDRFEEQVAREPRFTPEDVEAVVASDEFYEVGDAYFSGIWTQAGDPRAPGQHALLLALARAAGPAPADALAATAGLSADAAAAALEALERHDVIAPTDGAIDFTVPLLRRWLRHNKTASN